jgi:hypothetical protein
MRLLLVPALVLSGLLLGAGALWDSGVLNSASGSTSKTIAPSLVFTSAGTFTVTGTLYTTASTSYPSATCTGTPALLYPGVTRCEVFSVHNVMTVPISVTSITTSLDPAYPAPPAVCTGSNLTLPSYTGTPFTVPAGATVSSPGVPIALLESHTSQDACKSFTYHFLFSGSALYTDATTTSLGSTPNPSTFGQTVTFNTTVTEGNPAADPSGPAGTVNFYSCPTAACTTTSLLGAGTISNGQATYSTSSLAVGSHYVEATYSGSGTNLSGSTSNVVTQTVNYTNCITTKYSGNLTITTGQDICITTTGSVSGNVAVNSGGRLDLLGGSVSGNLTTSGGAVNITSGSISGNLSETNPTYSYTCGLKLSGNLAVSGSSRFVLVGDNGHGGNSGCAANTISGNVSLSSNTAGAEIGANHVNGGVTLTGTTGAGPAPQNATPEVEANVIGGGLSCSSNTPAPTNGGYPNTVSGKRSGQCSAAGF